MTLTIKVTDFRKGPRNARRMGARFNPAAKTWTVSESAWLKATPTDRYGLSKVHTQQHDHNCPANYGGKCECQ